MLLTSGYRGVPKMVSLNLSVKFDSGISDKIVIKDESIERALEKLVDRVVETYQLGNLKGRVL